MKPCPDCGGEVSERAKFCRHCGSVLRAASSKTPTESPQASLSARAEAARPPAEASKIRSKADARKVMVRAVAKSLTKSLGLSAAVLGPGMLLLVAGQWLLGTLWLFAGSFGMVGWTYHKPWRLGAISCLIPPVAAGLCYLLQLWLFASTAPPFLLVLGAVALGSGVGWVRGQAHGIYQKDGQLFAQRTVAYLVIWAVAYGITQLFAFVATNVWLVRAGLVTGAFSTAMLVVVSIIILQKRNAVLAGTTAALIACMFIFLGSYFVATQTAHAQSSDVSAEQILQNAFDASDIGYRWGALVDTVRYREPWKADRTLYSGFALDARHFWVVAAAEDYARRRSGTMDADARFDHLSKSNRAKNRPMSDPGIGDRSFFVVMNPPTRSQSPKGFPYIKHFVRVVFVSDSWVVDVGLEHSIPPEDFDANYAPSVARKVARAVANQLPGAAPPPRTSDEQRTTDPDTRTSGSDTDQDTGIGIDPEDAGAIAAAVAIILIAAGIAANLAQAIAGAIASSIQAGVEFTANDLLGAIGSGGADGDGTVNEDLEAQPEAVEAPSVATPGYDNTGMGWTINFVKDFTGGSASDTVTLIVAGFRSPQTVANAVASGANAAWEALSNSEVWTIAGETIVGMGKDTGGVFFGDREVTEKVAQNIGPNVEYMAENLGKGAEYVAEKIEKGDEFVRQVGTQLVEAAAKDPAGVVVAVGKAVLGTKNWGEAINPDVPVTERVGRAIWGIIDTGSLVIGTGAVALKGAGKIADLVRVGDAAGDIARGAKIADAAGDAAKIVKAADSVGDAADVAKAADATGDAANVVRAADSAEDAADVAKAADAAGDSADIAKVADTTGDTADAAKVTEEMASTRRDLLPDGRKGGPYTERYGVPDMATDPEGYVRELPSGALVDRNLANGSGYTGYQIDDMARMAKGEKVIVGARITNIDAMRHIRDGNAIAKLVHIKSQTIGKLDVYLGSRAEDKGLVGYFRPNNPDKATVPDHLWKKVNERYDDRLLKYNEQRGDVTKMINERTVVEKNGKLYGVIRKADGSTEIKPFAGDIDAVYFKNAETDQLLKGDAYDKVKKAWMGGKGKDFPEGYWARSGAPGQHGAEANVVADLTRGKIPGTPEYEKALNPLRELHARLAQNHYDGKEVVLEMHPDGHLRRGMRFSEDAPLPDVTRMK